MYNGKINREATVADGLDPDSKYYAGDFWKKYGTRYFWSPSVEMLRIYSLKEKIKKLKFHEVSFNLWKRYFSPEELHKVNFFTALNSMSNRYLEKGEMNSLLSYKGNAYPTPLYWQFLTQTRDFYSWTTDYEKDYTNLTAKKVGVEKKLLDKLVSDWGVFINHGYYVRNSSEDGNLIVKNGKLVTNPYFDKILGLMAKMRDDGDLYVTTIRDLLDYWTLTENVSFDYEPGGLIIVNNRNDKPIKGLSLVVGAKDVKVNGQSPKTRKVGDNLIFWFDIDAKQRLNISLGE
jgi:co-chaperonin GroES (HSP10)